MRFIKTHSRLCNYIAETRVPASPMSDPATEDPTGQRGRSSKV